MMSRTGLNQTLAARSRSWLTLAFVLLTVPVCAQDEIWKDAFVLTSGPCRLTSNTGAPEGVRVGRPCDRYIRTDAPEIYLKITGTGNTGWARVVTGTLASTDLSDTAHILRDNAHAIPALPDAYDLGSGALPWRSGHISNIYSTIFAQSVQQIVDGTMIAGHGAGLFLAAVGSSDTTINFGQAMTVNDFVLVRSLDTGSVAKTEYAQVLTLVSGTVYNVTRDLAAAHGTDPAWPAGTPYLVLGHTGDYRVELGAASMNLRSQGATYSAGIDQVVIDSAGISVAPRVGGYAWNDGSAYKFAQTVPADAGTVGLAVAEDSGGSAGLRTMYLRNRFGGYYATAESILDISVMGRVASAYQKDAGLYLWSPNVGAASYQYIYGTSVVISDTLAHAMSGTPAVTIAAGALTTTGVMTASGGNSGDWNEAHGWGDHAGGGYEAAIAIGTTGQYWRGDKSWQTLDPTAVGLSAVTNNAQVTSVGGSGAIGSSGGTAPTISVASGYTIPTDKEKGNYDSAYGWGDHSTGGYLATGGGSNNSVTSCNAVSITVNADGKTTALSCSDPTIGVSLVALLAQIDALRAEVALLRAEVAAGKRER